MKRNTYYITTPIYYPSGKLHIGHSYTTVAADVMARYKRLQGYDVMFLTGTDEHGLKIQRAATESGVTPKEYVDNIVLGIEKLWSKMNITHDRFIRTTDAQHIASVQKIFKKLYDKGDIYKSEYEGWYCTPCESFWTETQLTGSACPDCGRLVERTKEESYFFKLSKYQDRLIELFEGDNDFIQPSSRRNEMLNNFLRPGLEDLCVSRTSFTWGIPVEFDNKHVVYVWIDALTNYITALGYLSGDCSDFDKYWPADVHLVGKEIVRFHTIIWPAMLMALDLPLPKQVYGHGWLVLDGGKMSKSQGNVVDPVVLIDMYGLDAIRYFLLREVPFGADGVFSNEVLIQRINTDLANDLGNLVSRVSAMISKYFEGTIPHEMKATAFDSSIEELLEETPSKVEALLDKLQFSTALAEIWKAVSRANKYIDENMPWSMAKDEAKKAQLASVMHHLAESIRIVALLIEPFMPETPAKIAAIFNIPAELLNWTNSKKFIARPWAENVAAGQPIFPRIDTRNAETAIKDGTTVKVGTNIKAEPALKIDTNIKVGTTAKESTKIKADNSRKAETTEMENLKAEGAAADSSQGVALIGIEQFSQVELRVAKVLTAKNIKKSDKLLELELDDGMGGRTVVSGIAKYYTPEEVVGKNVVIVANLKPVTLRGVVSQGMILAASNDDDTRLTLVTLSDEMPPGTRVN